MADLRTDFVDDILDTTQNLSRVYNIKNRDGSVVESDVIIEDVSVYTQQGTVFGASHINETNRTVNELNQNLTTVDGEPFRYAKQDGKRGILVNEGGADTFYPFKQGGNFPYFVNLDESYIFYMMPFLTDNKYVFVTYNTDFNVKLNGSTLSGQNTGYKNAYLTTRQLVGSDNLALPQGGYKIAVFSENPFDIYSVKKIQQVEITQDHKYWFVCFPTGYSNDCNNIYIDGVIPSFVKSVGGANTFYSNVSNKVHKGSIFKNTIDWGEGILVGWD